MIVCYLKYDCGGVEVGGVVISFLVVLRLLFEVMFKFFFICFVGILCMIFVMELS